MVTSSSPGFAKQLSEFIVDDSFEIHAKYIVLEQPVAASSRDHGWNQVASMRHIALYRSQAIPICVSRLYRFRRTTRRGW